MSEREMSELLKIELSASQAWALAQFVKRVGWQEMRACAASEEECYAIRGAIDHLRTALADQGYAPR